MVHYRGAKKEVSIEDIAQFESGYWVAEEKMDGIWIEMRIDMKGKLSFFSRNDKDKSMLLGIKDLVDRFKFPEYANSILLGEIAFGSQASTNFYRENGYRRVSFFNVLVWKGEDYSGYSEIERRFKLNLLPILNNKEFVVVKRVANGFKRFYDEIVNAGGEGIMLKRKDARFHKGKGLDVYKCKKEVTNDYVVMGFEKSTSDKYGEKDWIKNILCGLYINGQLKQVLKVGSMTEEWREKFSGRTEYYKGKIIEAKGKELFRSGALRHPSFVRIRTDKSPEECVL